MPKRKYDTGGLSSRNAQNIFVFLSTFMLIISLVKISSGQHLLCWENSRNTNSENDIEYEEYSPADNYTSPAVFNSGSMKGLYDITKSMMNSLIPDILPKDLFETANGIQIKDNDYAKVLQHYMSYLIFISVFLLFAILMPIIGFCFCCCRCCGNCGAKVEHADKKRDHRKKVVLGSLLLVLVILFLFGLVGAFGTNQQLQEGTDNLVSNLDASMNVVNEYFNDISNHMKHLMKKNLNTFSVTLIATMDSTSKELYNGFSNIIRIDFIDDASNFAEKLEPMKKDLQELERLTKNLRVQALQINDATRAIKTDLVKATETCLPGVCEPIKEITNKLVTNLDLNQIPDLKNVISDIGDIDKEIVTSIDTGKRELEKVKLEMNNQIEENVNEAKETIKDTTKEIVNESEKFLNLINDMNNNITEMSKDSEDKADKFIKEYSKYRYILGLAVSCIFLLIAICIFMGLVTGLCTDRRDLNNSTCCNKSVGSGFLIFGVGVMFFTSTILVIILIVHNVAMIFQLLVCDPLRNPNNNSVVEFLDNIVKLEEVLWPGVSLNSVLTNCYQNYSVYEVFNIEEKFDVNDIKDRIDELKIEEIIKQISDELQSSGIIEELKKNLNIGQSIIHLKELQDTGLGEIDFEKFNIDLDDIDMTGISTQLNILIENLPTASELAENLRKSKLRIDVYIDKLFNPMKETAKDVMKTAKEIIQTFNSETGFKGALNELIVKLEETEEKVKTIDFQALVDILDSVAVILISQTDTFVDFTIDNVKTKLGKCAPLALGVDGILISTCDHILQPMNGFWFSIFWCLVFYVPMIIISVKLGTLFKKVEPFSVQFPQPNGTPTRGKDFMRNQQSYDSRYAEYGPNNNGYNPIARKNGQNSYYY